MIFDGGGDCAKGRFKFDELLVVWSVGFPAAGWIGISRGSGQQIKLKSFIPDRERLYCWHLFHDLISGVNKPVYFVAFPTLLVLTQEEDRFS